MKKFRKASPGSNLVIFCGMVILLLGMLGISIYVGMQAFVQSEIQKAAGTAAMAGAAAYYSGNPGGRPTPDVTRAKNIARNTFNAIVANSGALKGLGVSIVNVTNNDNNDSITVTAEGAFGTSLLAPIGISKVEVKASGTARSLKYAAAGAGSAVGPITILPDGTSKSMQQTLELAFPLVDNPGTDLYTEQAQQIEYVVEACNSRSCYDIVPAATKVGTGRIKKSKTGDGSDVILGSATFDLAKLGVRKASKLRFTHGNNFAGAFGGQQASLTPYPTPLMLNAVYIFGYASMCPSPDNCPVPAGFMPVE
jgi:hypothetical protein